MNKIFKVELYIDNVCNTNYDEIESILNIFEKYDLCTTLIKCEEKDVSDITEETDDYAWNTTDEKIRLEELNKIFFEKVESEE